MKTAIFLFGLLLVAGLSGWHQRTELTSLSRENAAMKAKLDFPTTNASAANLNAEELALRQERLELLRLRARAAREHNSSTLEPIALKTELDQALKDIEKENSTIQHYHELGLASGLQKETKNVFQTLVSIVQVITRKQKALVSSFNDITAFTSSLDPQDALRKEIEVFWTNQTPRGISREHFEFLPGITAGTPRALLLRERSSRSLPDGTWTRMYARVNGSIKEAISSNNNFEAWELENGR